MNDSEKVSLQLYKIVVGIKDTLSLPTQNTLEKTIQYSMAMLVSSVLSQLLGFYTFLSWQGCLLCTLVLIIFILIERGEKSAILKMYSTARASTQAALRRAKAAGSRANSKSGRANNNRNKNTARKRKPANAKDQTRRSHAGSN